MFKNVVCHFEPIISNGTHSVCRWQLWSRINHPVAFSLKKILPKQASFQVEKVLPSNVVFTSDGTKLKSVLGYDRRWAKSLFRRMVAYEPWMLQHKILGSME